MTHRRFNDIGGLQLVEDDAGLKHLRFQTTSLAGTSEWTDPIVFYPHVIIEPTGGATAINTEYRFTCIRFVNGAVAFSVLDFYFHLI